MADDFYTMQDVMEKLRKSEDEVQNLVKQGRLRQYMDAGNPMFKTADVDSLAEEIVGLDISSLGIDLSGSELDLDLMGTGADDLLDDDLDFAETGDLDDMAVSETELPETADIDELAGDDLDLVETGGLQETEPMEIADLEASEINLDEAAGIEDLGGSELNLAETSEILLDADTKPKPDAASSDEIDLKAESSEGGFGLSQMGDLTMADTNVGTVGINILSGTEDSFKLTEDTKAETMSADAEAIDELESLDADANMESFGSGSGLLDLSLQADDTSLGAVLDDILPAGAEEGGGDLPVDQIGLADETEDLLAEPAMAAAAPAAEAASPTAAAPAGMPVQQMVAMAQVDPRTNLFGIAMFLPLTAIIIVGIILTGAMRGITPSLMKMLTETKIADIGLFWYVLGGLGVFAVLFSLVASLGGGSGETKTKKTKADKEKKPKKAKAPKPKKEKKAKKKK